jgi:type IV pilus assembly protein PilM
VTDRTPTPEELPADEPVEETEGTTLELDAAAAVELLNAYVPKPDPAPEPELAPEPEPAATTAAEALGPIVVHPPVPAAQLPPLPEDEPEPKRKTREKESASVPFYKRELSFGRKKKAEPSAAAAEPAPEPEPAAKPKKAKKAKAPKGKAARAPRTRGGKRLVGLKVGASQLAAATVSNNGHAEVVQVARQPLPPGVVSGGELRDPDRLAEELKEFFAEHKLPKRGVRLGIATNRIGVRTLEIAGIDDSKQLANAITYRAQEALPIPIDEAVLDYVVLDESKNEDGETVRRILLVLAYRDLIDRYVGACRKAGIQLAGIDLEAFALLRALAAPPEGDVEAKAAVVAVAVGHERTTLAVSDGRVCEFTRVLDWGGHKLNIALARALDLSPSEVEGLKRELSLEGGPRPDRMSEEQMLKAQDALRRQVQSFARELVSSLQFYQGQPGSLSIGEIVVTGGTAHLGGFADELQRTIGVRVRVGDPLVRVKLGKKLREPEQLGSLAVAIGLGIED